MSAHVLFILKNCALTGANVAEFDLFVKNDGDKKLNLNSLQFGVNIDLAAINGGVIKGGVVAYNPEIVPPCRPFSFPPAFSPTHARFVGGATPSPFTGAPPLPVGGEVFIGRFSITNSNDFAGALKLALQNGTGAGYTVCAAIVYVNGATITSSLVAPGGVGTDVQCNI